MFQLSSKNLLIILNLLGKISRLVGVILGYFQRHGTLDMQIALRECDFDPADQMESDFLQSNTDVKSDAPR